MRESAAPNQQPDGDALRLLIVDDHDLFRTGLRNVLEERGMSVAAEATSGEDAVEAATRLAPDVVLMDLRMPGMGGLEATRRITAAAPRTRVLVLTVSDSDSDVIEAILAGACGYLVKDSSLDDLVRGIELAARGEAAISPSVATKVLDRVRATTPDPEYAVLITSELSQREIEVLKLLAHGQDNIQIGRELVISPKTVKNHISSILAKLQVENRIQAALYAIRAGIA
jgi:DNA-binding NarL/FixJ family response regulator